MSVIKDAAEKAFEAESSRTEYLLGKAEKIVAAVGAVTGFQLFGYKNQLLNWLALMCLGLALLFALLAMRVKEFGSYPRENELLDKLSSDEITEEIEEQAISKVLLRAREQNACLNDQNATLLARSGFFLLLGFLLSVAAQMVGAFK